MMYATRREVGDRHAENNHQLDVVPTSPRRLSARLWSRSGSLRGRAAAAARIEKAFSNLRLVLRERAWRSNNGAESQPDRAQARGQPDVGFLLVRRRQLRGLLRRISRSGILPAGAGVSRIVIERPAKKARITIHTARPGVVIGKKGADIEKMRLDLAKLTKADVHLNIVEIS